MGRGTDGFACGFRMATPPRTEATRLVPRSSWSSAARVVKAPRTPLVRRPDTIAGATTTCIPVTREKCDSADRRSDAPMSKRTAAAGVATGCA